MDENDVGGLWLGGSFERFQPFLQRFLPSFAAKYYFFNFVEIVFFDGFFDGGFVFFAGYDCDRVDFCVIVKSANCVVYKRFFVDRKEDFVLFGSHSFAFTGGEDDGVIFILHRAVFSHFCKVFANSSLTILAFMVDY